MANEQQIERWNTADGPGWVRGQERMDRQLEPCGRPALERLALRPGARVLDVGCGCGTTTLALAERVRPGGSVVGVDISGPMLTRARERANGRRDVDYVQADAQSYEFKPAAFDAVFSRFGLMFFDDPVAAFANLARATAPGGRLSFVCWRSGDQNPWMTATLTALADVLAPPPPPPPGTPGPFSLADPDRVRTVLTAAGWESIEVEARDIDILVAATLSEALAGTEEVGPVAALLRTVPEDVRAAALVRAEQHLRSRVGPNGLRAAAAEWVVTACR